MIKKTTFLIACSLLLFCTLVFVDANEIRQERKRLERIERMVDVVEEQARVRGENGIVDALKDVREKINDLHSRIKERSDNVLENAFLDNNTAHCYFVTARTLPDNLPAEEGIAHIKESEVSMKRYIKDEASIELLKGKKIFYWKEGSGSATEINLSEEDIEETIKPGLSFEESIVELLKDDFYDCSYSEIDQSLFRVPEEMISWEDLSLKDENYCNMRIKSFLSQLRSIAEIQCAYDLDYKSLVEMADPEHSDYEDYVYIKEGIEECGGELFIKFSKDFGEENGYDEYCAYSVLMGEDEKVMCIDSNLTRGEFPKEEVNCVTGKAPNCSTY